MLFLLIKNELIKILKRTKTWIVFGLFVLFIGVGMYGLYSREKDMEKYNSPQYRLEQVTQEIKHTKESIKNFEESTNPEDKGDLVNLKESLKAYEEEQTKYQEQVKNGVNLDQWKIDLDENIKSYEESLNNKNLSESNKATITEELNELKYLKENNIKPLHGYEFNAYNYMDTIIGILGAVLLVVGISIFMSDIVSGECTPPTLKFLLVQPISRGKVLLSKFIAVTITVITMIMSVECLAFLGMGLVKGFDAGNYPKTLGVRYLLDFSNAANRGGNPDFIRVAGSGHFATFNDFVIKSLLLQILFMITCCAFIFLISTLFKSSTVSTTIAIIVAVAGTVAFQMFAFLKRFAHLVFLNYGQVNSVITGDIAYSYNNVNLTPVNAIIVMCVTTIISYIIAHVVFKKKDILI
ncbi:ABC transporter permease subunit [Clostridium weizhouense]|uniref:ABC transporter permease subunit n=1 Tax=Clostridium weizhouense TaxID=2859781 RepID=A0ABS7AS80_9CLOT|nr:ABC transporter permease subunit [Clostridium weizhouense]MBW6411530.1 ABC transporter permease subunit [Clostridium weizhouense]